MEMYNTSQALLYLLASALHCKAPKVLPELDYNELYKLSRFHSVTATVAMALESGGLLSEPYMTSEQIKEWKDARSNAVRKIILLDTEREQILNYFEEHGIWYLPLKGCILKDLYPKMGMRQMADNDILFDKKYQHQLMNYMKKRGYKVVQFGRSNHDVYEKLPVYNFEFHTELFAASVDSSWGTYYKNVKERLKKDMDNYCGYHFSDEDFYIYITAHAFKHFQGGGTGARSLMDIYMYVSKKGEQLDWDYIRGELNTLGIGEFEEKSRELAMKLFDDVGERMMTQKEQEMLAYFMGSGTYGTNSNRVRKKLAVLQADDKPFTPLTKLRFCLKRLFPGQEHMKRYNPFCEHHRWSIPFFWIYRLIKTVVFRRKAIRSEISAVKNAEEGIRF